MHSLLFPWSASLLLAPLLCGMVRPAQSQSTAGGPPPACSSDVAIANPGFESGSLAPWTNDTFDSTEGGSITVVASGHNSGHAVQLVSVPVQHQQSAGTTIIQTIPACPATNYSITFDYKLVSGGSSCYGAVAAYRQEYAELTHSSYSPNLLASEWTTVTFYYPNYIGPEIQIIPFVACNNPKQSATILYDNFEITPFGTLEPEDCPDRPLTLPNGDFESGQLSPWKFTDNEPNYTIVSPGHQSNYALAIDVPLSTRYWNLRQKIHNDTCLGYNYTYSFDVNWGNYSYERKNKQDGCLLISAAAYCYQEPGSPTFYIPPAANSGWQTISYTCLPANSKALYYLISLECYYHVGSPPVTPFTLQLDNFSVKRTPGT